MGFVNKSFNDIMTFTRNSTATYVDPTGKIRTAGVNEPRFTFDPETGEPLGLLIEEQRTNLFTWSDDFSNPAWAKVNGLVVTPTTINGVVQGTTFTEIDDFDTNSSRYLRQIITVPNNSSTYSAWGIFKKSTSSVVSCRLSLTGGTAVFGSVDYNFDTDTFSSSANITTERRLMRDSSVMLIWKITNNGTGNTTLDARFFSTGAGGGVGKALINVLQLEQASTPSSYIPTEASAVTRLADNVSRTLGAEFNPNEGSLFIDGYLDLNINGETLVQIGNASNEAIRLINTAGSILLEVRNASGTIRHSQSFTYTSGTRFKALINYGSDVSLGAFNGVLSDVTVVNYTSPSNSTLTVGARSGFSNRTGRLSVLDVTYRPRALSSAEAQALTKI